MKRTITLALATSALTAAFATQAQTAPPVVIRGPTYIGSSTWAHEHPAGQTKNGAATLGSTTGSGNAAAAVNSTGSNLQVNQNTIAQPATVVIQANVFCPAGSMSWSAATSCSGTVPQTVAGSNAVATDSIGPAVGSATYTCQSNGTWSPPTSPTCTATCGATTLSWAVGGNTCSANIAARTTGQSLGILDSTAPVTGSASYTCSATGSWSLNSGYSCVMSQPPLGSVGSDYFIYVLREDSGGSMANVIYALQISYLQSYGLQYGDSLATVSSPSIYLPGTFYSAYPSYHAVYFAGQNCQYQVHTLRLVSAYVSTPGYMCRSGYTP